MNDRSASLLAVESSTSVDDAFETFLEEFAAAFARVPSTDVDDEIDRWLRRIVEFFEADRSSIIEVVGSEGFVSTHSYARPGFDSAARIRMASVPWLVELWQRGEGFHFSDISEVPAETHGLIHQLGLRSHVSVPVRITDQLIGAFAIGDIRRSRHWSVSVLRRLRLVANTFGGALARRRASHEYMRQSALLAHAGRVAAMSQLASSFAHEINQPLGASLTNAQAVLRLLKAAQPNLDDVRAGVEDIAVDTHRAGEIVRELRRFLRRQEPDIAAESIAGLLHTVVRFLAAEARSRDVTVEVEAADGLSHARADRVQIQQVLVNLLLNAFDALAGTAPDRRRIVVCARQSSPHRIELSVADTGPGVPAAEQVRIFEPFVTTKVNGLGIGLAIARTIVAGHGGHLRYRDAPGGGAVFEFSLDAAAG